MTQKAVIMDDKAMQRAVARISYEIIERNKGVGNLCIVGVMRRGVNLAQRIAAKIEEVEGKKIPLGILDITPYRDDRETAPDYEDRTDLPFEVASKKIVLVDDVVYTGRSVRAARYTPVSFSHLRAHETGRNLVFPLLLEKKKVQKTT